MNCIILGDSISEGIGKKKTNYIQKLSLYNNEYDYINMAKTGTTINYCNSLVNSILKEKPNKIIIMYGSVDAQIRPDIDSNKYHIRDLIPNRYKRNGMLYERAFYSKKLYRIIPDRVDNIVRKLLRKIIVKTQGTIQWVSINDFEKTYDSIIKTFVDHDIDVVCISTIYIDDQLFLNSGSEYKKYNSIIKKISKKYNCKYLDIYKKMKKNVELYGWDRLFSKDHFHPNENGYDFIAKSINELL